MVFFHIKTMMSIDLFEVVEYVISKQENFSIQEITFLFLPCSYSSSGAMATHSRSPRLFKSAFSFLIAMVIYAIASFIATSILSITYTVNDNTALLTENSIAKASYLSRLNAKISTFPKLSIPIQGRN